MHLDANGKPVWKDGDVVKIRFVRKRDANPEDGLMLSNVYEYRREGGYWPGEQQAFWASKEDVDMTAAWEQGRLGIMEMVDPPVAMSFILSLRSYINEQSINAKAYDPKFGDYEVIVLTDEQRRELLTTADPVEIGYVPKDGPPTWRGLGIMTAPEDVVLGFPYTHLDCRSV
jgi:hypothetical protein